MITLNTKRHGRYFRWTDWMDSIDGVLTEGDIARTLSQLWAVVYARVDEREDRLMIQFKVRLENGVYRSIVSVQVADYVDQGSLLALFNGSWTLRSEEYHIDRITSVVYTYRIIPDRHLFPLDRLSGRESLESGTVPYFMFHGYDLPVTMNFVKWGDVTYGERGVMVRSLSNQWYRVESRPTGYRVEVWMGGRLALVFEDSLLDPNDLSVFCRRVQGQRYLFHSGVLRLKGAIRGGQTMAPLEREEGVPTRWVTMDIETVLRGVYPVPYCASVYDGVQSVSFYVTDYGGDSNRMVAAAIESLMRPGYRGYHVYLHNFSRFDGVFLLQVLSRMAGELFPIVRNGRVIELAFRFGIEGGVSVLYFRDSYLLLPHSLRSLAHLFCEEEKGLFPHRFVSRVSVSLEYEGPCPAYSEFEGVTPSVYGVYAARYRSRVWRMREEAINHCERDCRSLYGVLAAFSRHVYAHFRVDVCRSLTLSSLALLIYRTCFLRVGEGIPLIGGDVFVDMHRGYTGGRVDVYRPSGRQIYRYDVNSLYPYVMGGEAMPVGEPTYFEGEVGLGTSRPFGVFEVAVTTPMGVGMPMLQRRFGVEGGIRTVAPLGCWVGVYFSEEVYAAIEQGYGVRVIRGYQFERGYPFKGYVRHLHGLKAESERGEPVYTIAKLLLNGLYGRLGMDPSKEVHRVVGVAESIRLCVTHRVGSVVPLGEERELVSYRPHSQSSREPQWPNVSVSTSLAITAYARLAVTEGRVGTPSSLYYTDTDSVDVDGVLGSQRVGVRLGLMRLERFFDRVAFLSPKVYGGRTRGGEQVVVKGVRGGVPLSHLNGLLRGEGGRVLVQDRWRQNVRLGELTVAREAYTLTVTEGKRRWVRDARGRLIGTLPLVVGEGVFPLPF